jgi:GNAT superfamily N-acetyltransferase
MVIDTSDLPPLNRRQQVTIETSQEPTTEWLSVQGQQFADVVHRYPANYISILIDGHAVASGRIAFNGGWGVITDIFVTNEHRRQGVGRLVMHALADTAREQYCSKLTLQVDSSESPALSLCETLGFRLHHRDRCRVLPAK